MLTTLTVKNLAIIDNIQIDFENGMTVLTGETGAGKSLIIDAIGLLFGDRASSELVRAGETKTFIEGVFTLYNNKVKNILKELDIDDEDVLIIRREIYQTGKSIGKINGNSVSVSVLSLIGNELGNIHTQFDTQKLINPNNYFNFIDDDNINNLLKIYKENLLDYRKKDKIYNEIFKEDNLKNQKLEFLKYQALELQKANLNVSEEEELQKESKLLLNYEKIMNNYNSFINIYEDNSVLDNIYDSINYLEKIKGYDENLNSKIDSLNEVYYNLNDLVSEISSDFKKIDYNESELDRINERLGLYSDLKRKYKMSTSELITYYESIKSEVERFENHDFYLKEAKKSRDEAYNKTIEIANNISALRKENALILEQKLINSLIDLQLKNVVFNIELSKGELKDNGQDLVDFLVSFNKGENPKSLNKTLSGGELSRFMLALKEIASNNMKNQTLIFDEIDSGVSGEVAYSIANKIKEISKHSQVLCVTHLAQVASVCDNHYDISKKIIDEKTRTFINVLSYDEKINKIAEMISNGKPTTASINLAIELLDNK